MKTVKIILCGCGGVGKEFLQLIADRYEEIKEKYNLNLVVCAAVDCHGAAIADSESGLPIIRFVDYVKQGNEVQTFPVYGIDGISGVDVINQLSADVMVETTPTNMVDGGAAKEHVFCAIDKGMEIVSANKGPFVLFYEEVFKRARKKGCGLQITFR